MNEEGKIGGFKYTLWTNKTSEDCRARTSLADDVAVVYVCPSPFPNFHWIVFRMVRCYNISPSFLGQRSMTLVGNREKSLGKLSSRSPSTVSKMPKQRQNNHIMLKASLYLSKRTIISRWNQKWIAETSGGNLAFVTFTFTISMAPKLTTAILLSYSSYFF